MAKKIESGSRISFNSAYKVLNDYPYISKIISPVLEIYKNSEPPPLIDQVNPLIQQLNCYSTYNCNKCENLLEGMNRLLERMDGCSFLNKDNLLTNLSRAKDEYAYRSIESEILLANFFLMNNVYIVEYEPAGKETKRADFRIRLGRREIIVELVTPNHPDDDYIEKERSLIEKLRRIKSGLSIEISGFELYDRSTLWKDKVEPPTNKQIEEIVSHFRKQAKYITEEELPKELTLSPTYPKIKITVHNKLPNNSLTHIFSGASRSSESFPKGRIINMILDERKHLSSSDINFVFVDLSYWNRPWFDLGSPFREEIINTLEKNISSRINAVFTYTVGNSYALVNRGSLYKDQDVFSDRAIRKFLSIWG